MGWCTRIGEGGLPEEPPRPILERKEDDDQLDGEVVEDELVDPIDQIIRERAFFDPRVLRARTDVHRTRENDEQPKALPQDVVHHLGEENADFLVRCCSRTELQFGWGNQRQRHAPLPKFVCGSHGGSFKLSSFEGSDKSSG